MIDLTGICEWANDPNLSALEKPNDVTQLKVQLAIAEQLKRIADEQKRIADALESNHQLVDENVKENLTRSVEAWEKARRER